MYTGAVWTAAYTHSAVSPLTPITAGASGMHTGTGRFGPLPAVWPWSLVMERPLWPDGSAGSQAAAPGRHRAAPNAAALSLIHWPMFGEAQRALNYRRHVVGATRMTQTAWFSRTLCLSGDTCGELSERLVVKRMRRTARLPCVLSGSSPALVMAGPDVGGRHRVCQ